MKKFRLDSLEITLQEIGIPRKYFLGNYVSPLKKIHLAINFEIEIFLVKSQKNEIDDLFDSFLKNCEK